MKKNSFLVKLSISLVVAAFAAVLSFTEVTEVLENKFYDGLLHLIKDPDTSDKVLLLKIGDEDISDIGDWPWSRDVLANCLIRMKELGTKYAIFDIEYISPSQKAVPSNVEDKINNRIYETQDLTQQLIAAIPQALEGGTPVEEISYVAKDLIDEYLIPSYADLYGFISQNVSFDNDEYFGKACQFFGNTWLTVNNQDLGYEINPELINFIRNKTMSYQIEDEKDFIRNDNLYTFKTAYRDQKIGFTPAMETLIRRSAGQGYTNSNVDKDGIRRRMELLYEYDGKYLAQLVFAPLLSILDTNKITRTKYGLIIHDALYPDTTERVDVRIPLDNHGAMLINWQHEGQSNEDKSKEYGIDSANVYFLRNLDKTENHLVDMLVYLCTDSDFIVIDDEGYELEYVSQVYDLINFYDEISEYKEYLLSLCTGYNIDGTPIDGITEGEYESYFNYRKEFFNAVTEFVENSPIDEIKSTEHFNSLPEESQNMILELFNVISQDIKEYNDTFKFLTNIFKDKYCIIGQTAASTTDIGAIPFERTYTNVCIHANIMNTILNKDFISYYPWYFGFIASFILSMFLLLLHEKSSSIQNLIGGISRLALISIFILLFVISHIYIPILTSVIIFNTVDYLAGAIYRYLISSREKKFITAVASSFANKDTVEQLRKNPELFKTEGEKKYITALFSDIQKFSTFSETITKMYPEDGANRLIALLNEYLGAMSNEILANNGNIDKYEGDAIIAMFGAPDVMKLHGPEGWAYASLDSAIRMKKCEIEFNQTHQYLFEPIEIKNENGESQILKLNPFQTRIGLNSGFANVGLMGSKTETFSKLNYTMIGDTVNLASRLEGVNKPYKSWIMCSDDTWLKANSGENEGKIIARKLDRVRVVGRKTPVQLYNIVGFRSDLSSAQLESIDLFNEAYEKYILKDFMGAGKLFMQASNAINGDDTAIVLSNRCKQYIENGIPENWDGILNMTEK